MGRADDLVLIRSVDAAIAEAARLAGPHLACRVGCTECCIGPFLITPLDARRLRRGLDELDAIDGGRARRVRRRAAQAAALLAPHFDPAREEEFATRFDSVPCPALGPESGRCDLYDWRPITCRTCGPPVRFAGGDTPPPCRLCFVSAPEDEVERCRVAVDAEGLEERLLGEIDGPETIVALALANLPAKT